MDYQLLQQTLNYLLKMLFTPTFRYDQIWSNVFFVFVEIFQLNIFRNCNFCKIVLHYLKKKFKKKLNCRNVFCDQTSKFCPILFTICLIYFIDWMLFFWQLWKQHWYIKCCWFTTKRYYSENCTARVWERGGYVVCQAWN